MRFIWPESARSELRAIDREVAIRILHALTEYGESGAGDVKALAGQWQGTFEFESGIYRVIFMIAPDAITIVTARVRNFIEAG